MQIAQRIGLLGGKLIVAVGSDDVVTITHKNLLNRVETRHLLDNIDPRPVFFKKFSLVAALTAGLSLLLAVVSWWYGRTYKVPPDDGGYLFMAFILFVIFVVAAIRATKSRINIVQFNGRDNNRLFAILGNKPNTETVEKFCADLGKKIERIRYNGEISGDRMAEILTRHVEFLYENIVLGQAEYMGALEKIKNRTKLNVVKIG